jgi:uncharacterized protein YcbX
MVPISNINSHIPTYLRMEYDQDIKPNELVLKLMDDQCFPHLSKRSHTLYFECDLSNSEFVECKNDYRGFKESSQVNDWLSAIFGEKVFLMKCEKERINTLSPQLNPWSQKKDRISNFVVAGAIHINNTKSLLDLRAKVAKRYENSIEDYRGENVEAEVFRPSFLIDHDLAYCEEEFQEMRIANIMFR